MMASILLNPQLMIYSVALGGKPFFNFSGFAAPHSRDTDPNPALRLLKNFGRNVRATGPMFLLGVLLSALFKRYVPADAFAELFGFGYSAGFGFTRALIFP